MSQKRRKKLEDKSSDYIYNVLPLAVIIFLVPLIVYLKVIPLDTIEISYWPGGNTNYDFFSYYKMRWFIVLTILTSIVWLYLLSKKKINIKKTYLYFPIGIYTLFVVLSTIFSEYRNISARGFVDRYEGMLVIIGYMVIMFITINLTNHFKHVKLILMGLLASSLIIGLIGILQYFGQDFFKSDFGKSLILPAQYISFKDKLNFNFGAYTIYSTLYHYNYVGSYMAMLFPLDLVLLVKSKGIKNKIIFGLITLLMFINWIGSKSRAGVVGGIVAIIIFIIIERKQIFKGWKIVVPAIACMLIIFLILNTISSGSLSAKITSLYYDPAVTQKVTLKNIETNENRLSIETSLEKLNIINENNSIVFRNENNEELPYKIENDKAVFLDEKYKDYNINIYPEADHIVLKIERSGIAANFYTDSNGFRIYNPIGIPEEIVPVEKWGFEGKESLGSARGYIWSRSLPLIKNTLFIGHGPDTFAIYFPQNDYIGKLKAYGTIAMIVDKPHNLYLQAAINTGVISLLALLVLFFSYLVQSFKIYKKCDFDDIKNVIGLGIFISVIGYLVSGLFNDSVVSVAPVFWVLLGTGISINMMQKNNKIQQDAVK